MKDWLRAFASVFAAFLGVQSEKNKEHDFQHGRFLLFAISGLFLTLGFLIFVYASAKLVMALVS